MTGESPGNTVYRDQHHDLEQRKKEESDLRANKPRIRSNTKWKIFYKNLGLSSIFLLRNEVSTSFFPEALKNFQEVNLFWKTIILLFYVMKSTNQNSGINLNSLCVREKILYQLSSMYKEWNFLSCSLDINKHIILKYVTFLIESLICLPRGS